ncbi:MAG: hypothetical protein JNK05_32440 [Myxococcales bacterium]|nr:hypothetical protein [Myxococcales bacterium]
MNHGVSRLAPVALALALALAAPQAAADTSADEIATTLSGYERTADESTVRAWTERSIPTLLALAEDSARPEFVRARAAAALRVFAPNSDARAALVRLASAPNAHALVLRAALDGLCIGYRDLAIAARLLQSPVSDHREAAAWSISRANTAEARALLERASLVERDVAVRSTLASALRSMASVAPVRASATGARPLPTAATALPPSTRVRRVR